MDRSPILLVLEERERERDGILFFLNNIYVKNILIEFGIKISCTHDVKYMIIYETKSIYIYIIYIVELSSHVLVSFFFRVHRVDIY